MKIIGNNIVAELKVGDRVKFIDGSMNRILPKFYPSIFSKGTIIEIEDDDSDMRYLVKWDNPNMPVWYYTKKEITRS